MLHRHETLLDREFDRFEEATADLTAIRREAARERELTETLYATDTTLEREFERYEFELEARAAADAVYADFAATLARYAHL